MWQRWLMYTIVTMCVLLQIRNFNRYRVERRRKHDEAVVYLNSDVCSDPITRAQLGRFNLCEKASHIVNERPTEAALYDILNDWYPCGHGRCEGFLDWCSANAYWFVGMMAISGFMIYMKWMDYQRDKLFAKMRLPTQLGLVAPHVD